MRVDRAGLASTVSASDDRSSNELSVSAVMRRQRLMPTCVEEVDEAGILESRSN